MKMHNELINMPTKKLGRIIKHDPESIFRNVATSGLNFGDL